MPFEKSYRVAFDDVDHAGIVYYPRFFHYFHLAFEELLFSSFAPVGGYRSILNDRKLGFPAVHAEADYQKPLRFGDVCTIQLRTLALGDKSMTLGYTVLGPDGQSACIGKVTCAVVDLVKFRAVQIPDDVRTIFAALV
jgi:4-hydroxybenzoyl-CoA thioesterase